MLAYLVTVSTGGEWRRSCFFGAAPTPPEKGGSAMLQILFYFTLSRVLRFPDLKKEIFTVLKQRILLAVRVACGYMGDVGFCNPAGFEPQTPLLHALRCACLSEAEDLSRRASTPLPANSNLFTNWTSRVTLFVSAVYTVHISQVQSASVARSGAQEWPVWVAKASCSMIRMRKCWRGEDCSAGSWRR